MKILLLLMIPVLFFSCSAERDEPVLAPMNRLEVDGEAVWKRITVETDYRDYGEWSAHAGLQPGQSPHGVWHRVYGNRTLFEALPASDSTAPAGAIIVKENYDNNKALKNLTVMTKVEGYNPDAGDWYWAMFNPDGSVLAEGAPGGCISCHSGKIDNDFVIINPLNE